MGHWFEDVADHLGGAYLRYSFTKGTDQEVGFLVARLGLAPGARILDVGCGPGRHAHALGRLGYEVVGVDISERFVALARENTPTGAAVRFERADARELTFDAEFDAVISLCQGAFGLSGGAGVAPLDPDRAVLDGMARALRPGGRLALFEIIGGPVQPIHFPVPWAPDAAISFLRPWEEMRALLRETGFAEVAWVDVTQSSLEWFRRRIAATATAGTAAPPALGIHLLLGPRFGPSFRNLVRNLEENRLAVVQAVLRRA